MLPARESRGLPVVSVNVPEVDVEFLRIKEKELPKFFAEFQRGGRRSGWDLERDYSWDDEDGTEHSRTPLSKLAESVYVNRFVLGGKKNERVLTYLPLQDIEELQQPGLYFAVMKRTGTFKEDFETAFFTVSDLGLHTRAYKDKLFVHAASLESGAAISGVELKVLNGDGEPVMKAATDRNGNAMLDYKLDAAHVLIAQRGSDVSMLPFNQPALDLSEFAVAGREQAWFDVFAWSGRDLYRPGETVRLSALLRDQDGQPVAAQGQGAATGVRALRAARRQDLPGNEAAARRAGLRAAHAGDSGGCGDRSLARRVPHRSREQGCRAGHDPARRGVPARAHEAGSRRAGRASSPASRCACRQPAHICTARPRRSNRFTAKLTVAVEQHPLEQLPGWFFGDPTMKLPKEAKDVIDAQLDANGKLQQDIALPAEAKPVSTIAAIVTGSVFETGGRSVNRSLKRVLWPADALVGVRPLFDDKEGTRCQRERRLRTRPLRRRRQAAPGQGTARDAGARASRLPLELERRRLGLRLHPSLRRHRHARRRRRRIAAEDRFPGGVGRVPHRRFDPATKLTTRYPFNAGWSWGDENRGLDARPDKVKLALDKTAYRAGDTLKVTLTPPHAGKGLLMVESDHMLYVQDIEAKAGSTFEIPVTKDWERHDVYVTALVFRGGTAPSKITPARAVGIAHVPMDRRDRNVAVGVAVPKLMRPERDLPVTVSAPQLAGQEAFVTVSAVDVGILNITRFPVPDAAEHFFAQRRLGVDAYDVYGRVIESFEGGTAKIRFGGDMAPLRAAAGAPTDRARADGRPVQRAGEARCQGHWRG